MTQYLFMNILLILHVCAVIALLCWIIWRRRNIRGRRVIMGIPVEEEGQRGDDSEIVITPNNILMRYRRYQVLANRNREVVANSVINQPLEDDPPVANHVINQPPEEDPPVANRVINQPPEEDPPIANYVMNQPLEQDPPDDDYLTVAMEETQADITHSLYVTNRHVYPLV